MENQTKNCQNCKKDFVIESDDFAFYEKIKVPPPTFCSQCRLQRRLAFRSERFLYKRKCDFSGKEIFSMRPQEIDIKVYENSVWFSDKWDAADYAQDYDFSRSFFDQLLDLYRKVPTFALSTTMGVNSEYSNNYTGAKNCYLVFHANYPEDCMYGVGINYSKNCIDNTKLDRSENCYGNFFVNSSYDTFFSVQCSSSMNLWFCKDCVGCNYCVGCVGLRNKKYHIFNKPYTKEEYEKEFEKLNFGSYKSVTDFSKEAYDFWLKFPVKYMQGLKNFDVDGNYINNSKNIHQSFFITDAENMKYCSNIQIGPAKDCYDYSIWGDGAELVYECMACGLGVNNSKFCMECWPQVVNAEYSLFCQSSSDIFGCMGVKNKKYCILNKQYTKDEYFALREKIIEHMNNMPHKDSRGIEYRYGEFLPPAFSDVFYNHSSAYEDFPLSKEDAISRGYPWKENNKRDYKITKNSTDLPDNIKDVSDSILNEVISCSQWDKNPEEATENNCTEAFRILSSELAFYKKFSLPLPRKCPNCRYIERLRWKNHMKLYKRKCAKPGCQNEFETSYTPEKPEIVYCETCYQQEVV